MPNVKDPLLRTYEGGNIVEKIKEALTSQEQYLRRYGRPSEEDHALNDINRDLIQAMNDCYGQVYVGSINGDLALAQYDGGTIYNFAYDFCVPSYDEQLDTLLRQWKEGHKVCQLDAIYERIRILEGHLLIWV